MIKAYFVFLYYLFKIIQFPILYTDIYQQKYIFLSNKHCRIITNQPFYNNFNAAKYIISYI